MPVVGSSANSNDGFVKISVANDNRFASPLVIPFSIPDIPIRELTQCSNSKSAITLMENKKKNMLIRGKLIHSFSFKSVIFLIAFNKERICRYILIQSF